MRRRVWFLALFALLASAPAAHATSWAQPQIRIVVGRGLMAPSVAEFRPNDPLTRAELAKLVADLTHEQQVVVDPNAPVTVRGLDQKLVRIVGLRAAARHLR